LERRDFLGLVMAAGGASALGLPNAAGAADVPPAPTSESAAAFAELMALLKEIEDRWLSAEWNITRPQDVADGYRAMMHLLNAGLDLVGESDPERPAFNRMVSPFRKFQGDNPDAIYFSTLIRDDRAYRIRGNIAGAAYTSISTERYSDKGHYPTGVPLAVSDKELKVARDGSYEMILSPTQRPGNWFKLEPGVGSVTTRHYFEQEKSVAADPLKVIPLSIEPLDPISPRPAPTDASIAAGIRLVASWMRGFTLEQPPMMKRVVPSWVSTVPNTFKPPALPDGTIGFANRDAHYAMAPYLLKPDEALVMEGRFPDCRFANVMLWNRFLQTYDYLDHRVSLNRTQTKQGADGSFRIVVAASDPGVPNWLDTEARPVGLIYWRFIFPQGEVQPIGAKVVPLASLKT
jgi:hypothetical protein